MIDTAELELSGLLTEKSSTKSIWMFMPAAKSKRKEERPPPLPVNLTRVTMILRKCQSLTRKDLIDANYAMSKFKSSHLVALLGRDQQTVTGCYYFDESDHLLRRVWGQSEQVIDPAEAAMYFHLDSRTGELKQLDANEVGPETDGICM